MGYQAPLSERVRIQLEIWWENFTDCLPSMSSASYKKPLMLLVAVMAFATLRHSRRDVKAYGGYGGGGGVRRVLDDHEEEGILRSSIPEE